MQKNWCTGVLASLDVSGSIMLALGENVAISWIELFIEAD